MASNHQLKNSLSLTVAMVNVTDENMHYHPCSGVQYVTVLYAIVVWGEYKALNDQDRW